MSAPPKSERTNSLDVVRDYWNGYKTKQVNSSFGSMDIEVPQDCLSEFEPQVVKSVKKIFLILTERLFLCMQRD